MDEYPYVARASKSLASTLQLLIDRNKDSSKMNEISNMFRFWYRFVPENISVISRGATELAYRRIAPELPSYMGGVLETLVERSSLFHYKEKFFYIFAKTGFTKGCADRAAKLGNVELVRYDEMIG